MNELSKDLIALPIIQTMLLNLHGDTKLTSAWTIFMMLPRQESSIAFGIKLWNIIWAQARAKGIKATPEEMTQIQAILQIHQLEKYLVIPQA